MKKCKKEIVTREKYMANMKNAGKYFPQFLHILPRTRAATTNQIRRNVAKLFNSTVNQFEIVSGPDSQLSTPDSESKTESQLLTAAQAQRQQ